MLAALSCWNSSTVKRGDIHVHPADFAAAAPRGVDRLDRLEDVVESFLRVGFAGDQQQPLVALVDKDFDFARRFPPASARGAVSSVFLARKAQ